MAELFLTVNDLCVEASNGSVIHPILENISFTIGQQCVALVGESGSGKSMTARALLGLLPRGVRKSSGRILLAGQDLTDAQEKRWNAIRGKIVGLVLQDPKYSLNPVHRVGLQIEETLLLHTRLSRLERKERTLDMLACVGFDNPQRIYHLYPFELSGGMGQRVMIATMLIAEPKFLIADEPTSALDWTMRSRILDLLHSFIRARGMGLLLISHDLQQVAEFADQVMVMYRGSIIDKSPASGLPSTSHPYTQALWRARPSFATHGMRLPTADRLNFNEVVS